MAQNYQVCTRCVMDTTDPKIQFDENGFCNHCTGFFDKRDQFILPGEERDRRLNQILAEIKEAGKGKQYDTILGVSGGVDSTYMAFKAKELGLRPLAVHLDNGWNSGLAVRNIERLLERLDMELYTQVIDWEEFKDLQLAYFRSSVVDIEVATDHAIAAMIQNVAAEFGVKYILSGSNFATEGIMARSWIWTKNDLANLKDIHRRFGTMKLKTYPTLGYRKLAIMKRLRGYRWVRLLNYLDYERHAAKQILIDDFGWQDYGGKHFESIFTKFYQGHILPTKFNIDKRRPHLSTEICSGHITRKDALAILENPPYNEEELERDRDYVLMKLGLTREEWNALMALPIRQHDEFKTDLFWRKLVAYLRGR